MNTFLLIRLKGIRCGQYLNKLFNKGIFCHQSLCVTLSHFCTWYEKAGSSCQLPSATKHVCKIQKMESFLWVCFHVLNAIFKLSSYLCVILFNILIHKYVAFYLKQMWTYWLHYMVWIHNHFQCRHTAIRHLSVLVITLFWLWPL